MWKAKIAAALTMCALGANSVNAHNVGEAFRSRGECEAALAQINNFDRERLVDLGIFETPGEANKFFHNTFSCQLSGGFWLLLAEPRR